MDTLLMNDVLRLEKKIEQVLFKKDIEFEYIDNTPSLSELCMELTLNPKENKEKLSKINANTLDFLYITIKSTIATSNPWSGQFFGYAATLIAIMSVIFSTVDTFDINPLLLKGFLFFNTILFNYVIFRDIRQNRSKFYYVYILELIKQIKEERV